MQVNASGFLTQHSQIFRDRMMMINEDKLDGECAEKKPLGRRTGGSKRRKISGGLSLIFSLLCSSPRLTLACREKEATRAEWSYFKGKNKSDVNGSQVTSLPSTEVYPQVVSGAQSTLLLVTLLELDREERTDRTEIIKQRCLWEKCWTCKKNTVLALKESKKSSLTLRTFLCSGQIYACSWSAVYRGL